MGTLMGTVEFFSGKTVPAGWLPCDGRVLQISAYQVLFTLLSNNYGGDGRSTFALPKLPNTLTGTVTGKKFNEVGWCICVSGVYPQRQ